MSGAPEPDHFARARDLGPYFGSFAAEQSGGLTGKDEMETDGPDDNFPLSALIRLADALDTSVGDLLRSGGAGDERAEAVPELRVMDVDECRRCLRSATVGRVAYSSDDGPVVLPVNFGLVGDCVLFRTAADSPLACLAGDTGFRVAFEVDSLDPGRREGWSVVLTGDARAAPAAIVRQFADRHEAEPWPAGERDLHVVIRGGRITGRRIVHAARATPHKLPR